MESAWETNLRETTKATRGYVFDRDGHLCWMCGSHDKLEISHQIAKAAHESFSRFQANGTIPLSTVIGVSHHDNLFPLCKKCHTSFNSAFLDWVLIPDEKTIQKYIDHEIDDYEKRTRALTSQSLEVPRSLPQINRKDIQYQPLIINNSYNLFLGKSPKWPKPWMGEPTTVIHRASRRSLFESTPIQTFRLPGKGPARFWQTGVPEAFRILVAELINLWARQPPKRSG